MLGIGVFWIGAVFASLDVYAASLREILDKNGRDYVLANAKQLMQSLLNLPPDSKAKCY